MDKMFLQAVAGPMLQDDETRVNITNDIAGFVRSIHVEQIIISYNEEHSDHDELLVGEMEIALFFIKLLCDSLGVKLKT